MSEPIKRFREVFTPNSDGLVIMDADRMAVAWDEMVAHIDALWRHIHALELLDKVKETLKKSPPPEQV